MKDYSICQHRLTLPGGVVRGVCIALQLCLVLLPLTSHAHGCNSNKPIDCDPEPLSGWSVGAGPLMPTVLPPAGAATATVTVAETGDPGATQSDTVTLSCRVSGPQPAPACAVAPEVLTVSAASPLASATLRVTTTDSTPRATYSVSIAAQSASNTRPTGSLPRFAFTVAEGGVNAPLQGFVDLHVHPMANLGFGGRLLYGGVDVGALLPADPDCNLSVRASSMQQALGHDRAIHGYFPLDQNCGDPIRELVITNLQTSRDANHPGPDASGAPDFPDWPTWDDVTHQKMWVDWIRRAHQGGLRVMVALAVNNQTLGESVMGFSNFGDKGFPTDDLGSVEVQIRELKDFVARHPDFMEVALTPADLERIVRSNRLAVVLGVEVDNIANLGIQATHDPARPNLLTVPRQEDIRSAISHLQVIGVRYVFPVHLTDNAFGGTAVYESMFNYANAFETGRYWNLECTDNNHYKFEPQNDIATSILRVLKLGQFGAPPSYTECHNGQGQQNARGLTPEGDFAIRELMRRGMLIDIDHTSQQTRTQIIKIANAVPGGYPLNSGHNGPPNSSPSAKTTEYDMTLEQYAMIGSLHGMAGVGSGEMDAWAWADKFRAVIAATGAQAAAFGTDTNGLVKGNPPDTEVMAQLETLSFQECVAHDSAECDFTGPKGAAAQCLRTVTNNCRSRFPPTTTCVRNCGHPQIVYDATFPRSTLGTRTWDYNTQGMAHYGMLPEFVQDARNARGGAELIDQHLMTGADYFLKTWQKSDALKTQVPDPAGTGEDVVCRVFDDGSANLSAASGAIFINASQQACIPDGTSDGTCRKWFGQCRTAVSGVPVLLSVFNDGNTELISGFDAVFINAQGQACIPDGSAEGTCRRWFGRASTPDGRSALCTVFDDGNSSPSLPSDAVFINPSNQSCVPDNTAEGRCGKWWGACKTH